MSKMKQKTKQKLPAVKVGQVWIDNDFRHGGRRKVKVLKVFKAKGKTEAFALCRTTGTAALSRDVKIKLWRFKPTSTGYRLEVDPLRPAYGKKLEPKFTGTTNVETPKEGVDPVTAYGPGGAANYEDYPSLGQAEVKAEPVSVPIPAFPSGSETGQA